jgi:anthranilate synthase component I
MSLAPSFKSPPYPTNLRPSRLVDWPMKLEPTAEVFAGLYVQRRAQVVWTTLIADLETPASIFLKIAGDRPMSFLLESVEAGAVPGRYSIIGLEPDLIFRAHGACAEINRTVCSNPDAFASPAPNLHLKPCTRCSQKAPSPFLIPPMAAGLFGYLGYDMVRLMEELPPVNPDPIGFRMSFSCDRH